LEYYMTVTINGTTGINAPDFSINAIGGADISGVSSINGGQLAGFRNRIINGSGEVAQRGTSVFVSPSSGTYTLDRWYSLGCTAINIAQGVAVVGGVGDGGSNIISLTSTSATNSLNFGQALESYLANSLRGKTVTCSFYAATSAGTQSVNCNVNKNTTANTATGGTWSIIGTVVASVITAPTRFSITVSVPADATTAGIGVQFVSSNQANGSSIYIWGVQLEVGSTATPFESRPYGTELALCQRYYYRVQPNGGANNPITATSGFIASTTLAYIINQFPVPLRAIPTALEQSGTVGDYAVQIGGSTNTCTSVPQFSTTTSATQAFSNFTTAAVLTVGQGCVARALSNNSYLGWSAEL
jgi:hypothetical protein